MNRLVTLVFVLGLFSPLANAQTEGYGTTRGGATIRSYPDAAQRGFAGYLGLNAGYTGYNKNLDVEGAPGSVKLLGSYVIPNGMAVFDAGYGLQTQKFSQDAARDSVVSTGAMELAARYQFENRWQLGAAYNQFFNKGENYGANQADAEFAGVQVLREFGMGENYLGRLGGRIMTSVNVNHESVNMAMIDFQMGWGQTSHSFSTSAVR